MSDCPSAELMINLNERLERLETEVSMMVNILQSYEQVLSSISEQVGSVLTALENSPIAKMLIGKVK